LRSLILEHPLPWVAALAVILRLVWWLRAAPVISDDGSEYLCVARNLGNGFGLRGCDGAPELMYAPLYSVLAAALGRAVGDIELAAHIISLAGSVCIVVGVYLLAQQIYGRGVALIAALLATFHPLLIDVGGSTYNEGVYLPLLTLGVWAGLRAFATRRFVYCLLTGVLFGLAYLSRPEAFAYPLFFGALFVVLGVFGARKLRRSLVGAGLLVGMFLIIASPYVAFLKAETGQIRFEGKWNMNYTIDIRRQAGMDFGHAAFGVGDSADTSGPLLNPQYFASYTPFKDGIQDKLRVLAGEALMNRRDTYDLLMSNTFAGPILIALGVIGLFRTSWSRQRLLQEAVLFTMLLSVLVLVITAHHVGLRYVLPMLPLLVISMAKGVDELGSWASASAVRWQLPNRGLRTALAAAVPIFAASAMLAVAFQATQSAFDFAIEGPGRVGMKQAAEWLDRSDPGSKRVATSLGQFAWYAHADMVQLPAADPATTLHYLDSRHPDYVYVESSYSEPLESVNTWLSNAVDDARVQLVYQSRAADGSTFVIYRWLPDGTAAAVLTDGS
jgi:4-amino-4-deoxy-L-arabinose transferase-like glycosyltransferase